MHLTVKETNQKKKQKKNTHEEEVAFVNLYWSFFFFFHMVTGDSSICKRDGNLEYNEYKKGKAGLKKQHSSHLPECI